MMTQIRYFAVVLLSLLIVACGGSGESLEREDGGSSTPPPPPVSYSLTLQLVDASGNPATTVEDGSPLSLRASVSASDSSSVANLVVTFALNNPDLASFDNDAGTALTDANGVAVIQVLAGSQSGSGTITASIEAGATSSIGFTSSGSQQQPPASLELFASQTQLASSGSDQIELIASVKNAQNIQLENIPVSFSANQNASLSNVDLVTQADGTARALLTTQNDPENRQIQVTVSTSTLTQTLDLSVVGTEININGPSSIIINDQSPVTIILVDSDGVGIANETIALSVSSGILSATEVVTDSNGQATVNFSATSAGSATISANALNASNQFVIAIQEDEFSFVDLPSGDVALGTDTPIRLRWFRNNAPLANATVEVTTSRGEITVGGVATGTTTTNASGIAEVTVSSDFAGPASISATGSDGSGGTVTARAEFEFIATEPASIALDATPDLIGPDGQTSTITAVVRDADGNLVKGAPVDFTIIADSSGGSISPNSDITDSNGIARTVYTSNSASSDRGVTIRASSDLVIRDVDLTVGNRAFDISLGTGDQIEEPDTTTYLKRYAVFVTDSSGRPVSDVELSASATPTALDAYRKGFYTAPPPGGTQWVYNLTASCASEDGVLDEDQRNNRLDDGEDLNNDGFLTPGNVATVSFEGGVSRTNEFGQATIEVRYAQQFASWVKINLSIFGQSLGTESAETQQVLLPLSAERLGDLERQPPSSPYGIDSDCRSTE